MDWTDKIFILCMTLFIIGLIVFACVNATNYYYECTTFDNEIIKTEAIYENKGSIKTTVGDTTYMIKSYKRVKKGE